MFAGINLLSPTLRGNIEKKTVEAYRKIYGNVCSGYKRQPHYATDLTADHINPTSQGGDEFGQLQVLCRSCNSSKNKSII